MSLSRLLSLRLLQSVRTRQIQRPVLCQTPWRTSASGSNNKGLDVVKQYESKLSEKERAFDKEFVIPGPEADRGIERLERETRAKMKRVPRHQGDFSTLEEKHILYGARGTLDRPVKVESVYPSRIVGCFGSSETEEHDLLWHVVKRERPTVCLECGQVFQLVVPHGEQPISRHHDDHGHDDHGHGAGGYGGGGHDAHDAHGHGHAPAAQAGHGHAPAAQAGHGHAPAAKAGHH